MDIRAPREDRLFALPPFFMFYLGPHGLDSCLYLREWIFLTQPTDSNANLFQTQIYPEIMFYQLSGHPLAQSGGH